MGDLVHTFQETIMFGFLSFSFSFIFYGILTGEMPSNLQISQIRWVLMIQSILIWYFYRPYYVKKFGLIKKSEIEIKGTPKPPKVGEYRQGIVNFMVDNTLLLVYIYVVYSSTRALENLEFTLFTEIYLFEITILLLPFLPIFLLIIHVNRGYVDGKVNALQTCGCCGTAGYTRGEISTKFGFRRMSERLVNQPWCKRCRSSRCKKGQACKK